MRVVLDNQIDFNDLIMGDETEVIYIHLCFKLAWPGHINKRYCRAVSVFNVDCRVIPETCDIDDNPCQIENSNHYTRKKDMALIILMFTSPPNLRTLPKAHWTRGLSAFTKVIS